MRVLEKLWWICWAFLFTLHGIDSIREGHDVWTAFYVVATVLAFASFFQDTKETA